MIGSEGRLFFGTFPSEVRPEHVTAEALRMLKEYVNNDNLVIGGQSGSQRILDHCLRGHTVADIIYAVMTALEEGFIPNVDFIFGLPEERKTDVQATIDLMEHLGDLGARIHGHTFMPLPGTPFKNARPGAISPEFTSRLGRLAAEGKLYGQWKNQSSIAGELAEIARGREESDALDTR